MSPIRTRTCFLRHQSSSIGFCHQLNLLMHAYMWHAFLVVGAKAWGSFELAWKVCNISLKSFFFIYYKKVIPLFFLFLSWKSSPFDEDHKVFSCCEFFLARNLFFSKENWKWASVEGFWQGFLCFLFSHFFNSISNVLGFCVLFSIFGASM